MVRSKQHSLIIVGSGITGLSTAYHLEQRGIKNIAIAGPEASQTSSYKASGLVAGGTIDNFSRLFHAHGKNTAKELWDLGDKAFDYSFELCDSMNISSHKSMRYRLITSDHEMTESNVAVSQLQALGFETKFLKQTHVDEISSERIQGIQQDSPRGGFIDPQDLLQKLNERVNCDRISTISRYKSSRDRLELYTQDQGKFPSELMVLANHLNIPDLLPSLKDSIVSFADQWVNINTTEDGCPNKWAEPGAFYSANHTYEWGVRIGANKWRIGGGRYLRKFAGIEATSADFSDKINQHLVKQFLANFSFVKHAEIIGGQGFLDCRPCDELPIIGPMFGEPRILLSTGYMGSSLTLGLFAGYCLAELIANGTCDSLPRCVWPERLRSLPTTF